MPVLAAPLMCLLLSSGTAAAPAKIVAGSAAFVIESTSTVRAAPNDAAAAVRELAIWNAVRVDAVLVGADAGWVQVTVGPRVLRYDTPGGEARPVAPGSFDAAWPHGFMRITTLELSPTSRLGLVASAKSAAEPLRQVLLLRAWALDPNDDEVAAQVARPAARAPVARRRGSPFEKADLVFGCRGDVARARVVVSTLAGFTQDANADACVAHVDLRPPCAGDSNAPSAEASAAHKSALAHFVPRFPSDGPALRLVPQLGAADRKVFVVEKLLRADGCSPDCTPLAATSDVKVERLRVPRVDDGRTLLHVMVPRYTGALYDIVTADSADDVENDGESFELPESFDVDPRDDPPPGDHLFTAPQACCACDTEP